MLQVQIYRVNDFSGQPRCDQVEMFSASLFTAEQSLKQDVPGGLVLDPFRRSVEMYLDQLGLTLDDYDESKHSRDEKGRFSSTGGSSRSVEKSTVTKPKESGKISTEDVPASVARILKARDARMKQKTKYAPSKQRTSAKKYAQLCGTYMTRYPGLKPEDGTKTAFDENNIYRAQADGFGGADVKSRVRITQAKKKPKK